MALHENLNDPVRFYLWDASAFIKLYIKEGQGSIMAHSLKSSHRHNHFYTRYTITEALSKIKRYWAKGKIDDDTYLRLVLAIHDSSLKFKECPVSLNNYNYMRDAFGIVREYGIDIIDAAAIIGVQNGTLACFGGASGPYLVTADGGMIDAAKSLDIQVVDLRESKI